jgi:hypothetical protein
MIEVAQATSAAVEAIGTAINELRDTAKGRSDVVEQVDHMFRSLVKTIDDLGRSGGVVDLPPMPKVRSVN